MKKTPRDFNIAEMFENMMNYRYQNIYFNLTYFAKDYLIEFNSFLKRNYFLHKIVK